MAINADSRSTSLKNLRLQDLLTFGYLWLSLVTCGYLWLLLVTFGYLWLPLVTSLGLIQGFSLNRLYLGLLGPNLATK